MFSAVWKMLKDTVLGFINDEALSRGAAIAFYTVTSIAPVLLIVIAIAGLAFGRDAAQNAITEQLSGLMGQQTAEVLQTAVASAASKSSGVVATIIGIIILMVTASGVFGEMQTALNVIWKAKPEGTTVSRLIRARCQSRISRSIGISSYGVARCEHCADGVRQLPRFDSSIRTGHPDRSERRRFSSAHFVPVRRHL
jgi:membrane protein